MNKEQKNKNKHQCHPFPLPSLLSFVVESLYEKFFKWLKFNELVQWKLWYDAVVWLVEMMNGWRDFN